MPQASSSSPNSRAYPRTAASTPSACFSRLSLLVYSVSSAQASSRFMVSSSILMQEQSMANGRQSAVGSPQSHATGLDTEFHRGLGLYDSTMVVVGSMIGSGIFIVSADMSRNIGSPGWLLGAWLLTGILTVVGALSYGELAAMMPRAGGQYVYLREAFSPLWGFLYGWTLFLVIQTGTIAAVSVGFARYFGALVPWIADDRYLVPPIHLSSGYALSLSTTQLVGIILIALLTWTNTRGLEYGKIIQNVFTTAKTGALIGLILVGVFLGWNHAAVADNFGNLWAARGTVEIVPGLSAVT